MNTPQSAGRLFLLVMVLLVSGGLFIPGEWMSQLAVQIYFTQLGLILLPSLLYLCFKGIPPGQVFHFSRLSFRDLVFIILISGLIMPLGSFFNGVVLWVLSTLFGPVPMPSIPIGPQSGSLVFFLVSVALLPGITEELLSRGILLESFRPLGRKTALWASALLFALLHLHPGNFFGPLFLGLFFGWAVLKTGSLWAGILGHSIYNGLVILLIFFQGSDVFQPDGPVSLASRDLLAALPSTAIFTVILFLVLHLYNRQDTLELETNRRAREGLIRLLKNNPALLGAISLYLALTILILSLAP